MRYIKYIILIIVLLYPLALSAKPIKESLPHIYYVSFPVTTITGTLTVSGQYRLPRRTINTPIPAVVIVHTSGGIDSTGGYYTEALNEIGIATLEIDMWSPRGHGGGTSDRPDTVQETIPDAFAALAYLAALPEIDSERIGLLGFSWGGVVTMLSATQQYYDLMGDGIHRFAGSVAHYPICWVYNHPIIPGFEVDQLVGQPVMIQVGAHDDYEADPSSCQTFVDSLPAQTKSLIQLNTYRHAHHAWDRLEPALSVFDQFGHRGVGGIVDLIPNRSIAKRSRQEVKRFFKRIFTLEGDIYHREN